MAATEAKISVVVPVYNTRSSLPRVWESLQAQTIGLDALQIFFCDDCSTDDSYAYVKELADQHPNITVLQTEQNSGFAGAPRNLALERLETPYVMFLDSDDALPPDACKILYTEAETSGADLVTGRYREVQEDGTVLSEYGPGCTVSEPRKVYAFPQDYDKIHEVRQIFWCKIYRTNQIQQHHLRFVEQNSMEDVLFLAQYIMSCRSMVFLNQVVYLYTVHQNSLSRTYTPSFLAGRASGTLLLYKIYEEAGHPDCFDAECRYDAEFYLSLVFTSPHIRERDVQKQLLEQFQPLVRLSLLRKLFVADGEEQRLFELLIAGNYNAFLQEFPQYLLRRTHAQLLQTQQELHRVDEAYQGALRTCHALEVQRDAVQAKLNRWPLYRLARAIRHIVSKG